MLRPDSLPPEIDVDDPLPDVEPHKAMRFKRAARVFTKECNPQTVSAFVPDFVANPALLSKRPPVRR